MIFFQSNAYVRVKKNQFHVRHIESGKEATFDAQPPFTTTRLLIGEFGVADALLKRAFREMLKTKFFAPSPHVLMHPLEMLEGGLSEIELRILKEVALGAGAIKAQVWVGSQLTDAEVLAKLKG